MNACPFLCGMDTPPAQHIDQKDRRPRSQCDRDNLEETLEGEESSTATYR